MQQDIKLHTHPHNTGLHTGNKNNRKLTRGRLSTARIVQSVPLMRNSNGNLVSPFGNERMIGAEFAGYRYIYH